MRLPPSTARLTSIPFKVTRPSDGNARLVTEYPALMLNMEKYAGPIGGRFAGGE
jgi:hypothetical protein